MNFTQMVTLFASKMAGGSDDDDVILASFEAFEIVGIDLAVDLEGLEGGKDDVIIVGSTGHLGGEEGDHLGEVHGSIHLVEHSLCLSTTDVLAVSAEGGDEVGGGQKSVLVSVHDAKGLLELLDGRVGEGVEDVGFLRHDGVGGGAGGSSCRSESSNKSLV